MRFVNFHHLNSAMNNYNRRIFIKSASFGLGAVGFSVFEGNSSASDEPYLPFPPAHRSQKQVFDPWLDEKCKIIMPHTLTQSNGVWMWYPGQKTAHAHAYILHKAVRRCKNIGYPGSFCQPVYTAFFRKNVIIANDTEIQWTGPTSRIRFRIDGREGDITSRKAKLRTGNHLIEILVDFAGSLPCILIEGKGVSSPEGWETSLDERKWAEPEFESAFRIREVLPDTKLEVIVEIPVNRIISQVDVTSSGNHFLFSPKGSLIVDFWHDELGSIIFDAEGEGKISITTGESLEEVMDTNPANSEQIPLPDIEIKGDSHIVTPELCVRYAHIRSTGSCKLQNLRFNANITPVEYKGSFTCNDPLLNKIWEAGAATIHSCMHDFYLDGIKRDALSWADAVMGMFGGDCAFFDTTIAHNSIVSQFLPLNPTVNDFGILDYPPFVFLGMEHNYLVRGDLNFVLKCKQHLYDILDLYKSLQDKNGFVNSKNLRNWWFFPDWSITQDTGPERIGIPCYSQMLIMKSFETGSYLANLMHDDVKSKEYAGIAQIIRKNIRSVFWDSTRGVYINGVDAHGKTDTRLTSFAQVWGILFDLVKPEEYKSVFENVLDRPERNKLSVSLNQLFEGLAYTKAGRSVIFIDRLRKVWGEMLEMGYSRFAEDIRPWESPADRLKLYGRPYANSLCHVWAGATPVVALSRSILGIYPTKPGFSECVIQPEFAGLEWIKGSVPTPYGSITIELDKSKGGIITLPDNVKALLKGLKTESGKTELMGTGVHRIII